MAVKKRRAVVTADSVDLAALEMSLKTQGNAIPEPVAVLVRLVAPVLARVAIRYVARRLHRHVAESTVRAGGAYVGGVIGRILERAGVAK